MNESNECTWPEVKTRAHYVCWLLCAIATAALLGLTVDLLVVSITGGVVEFRLVQLMYLSTVVVPSVYVWRKYGEAHCGFLALEHAMDQAIEAPGGRWEEICSLVARIDSARGMDRQVARNDAKAWLAVHAHELSREEREYVADHLGYLHKR